MKNFNKIDSYLKGKLSKKEAALFEEEIKANKDLALEFSIQKFEEGTIRLAQEDELRNRIRIIQKESGNENRAPKSKVVSLRKWILPLSAIAASIMLIVGYFYIQNQFSNETLVAQYYNYSASNLRKGESSESILAKEKTLFNQGNFAEAALRLDALTEDSTVGVEATYLLGHCYFNMADFEKSSTSFNQVKNLESNAEPYLLSSKWYWVLSKLALGQFDDEFNDTLVELIRKGYPGTEALKEDLDSVWR